jgi:hypothetical protein
VEIDGDLDLTGTSLPLLTADRARIHGSLCLDAVRMAGGDWPLDFGPDALRSPLVRITGAGFAAIRAESLAVDGTVSCRRLEVLDGGVSLAGAQMGALNLRGAILQNSRGAALSGDRMMVARSVMARSRFSARGTDAGGVVSLRDAKVGGSINLWQATIVNARGPALVADGLAVAGSMILADLVVEGDGVSGALRLSGASVGAELRLDGARVVNATGPSLVAERLQVEAGLSCEPSERGDGGRARAFGAGGRIDLTGARIGGPASFDGARLPDGVSFAEAEVRGRLSLRLAAAPGASVDLRGARLGALRDGRATWPAVVELRGCTYGDLLRDDDEPLHERLAWVARGALDGGADHRGVPTPSPQPYEQLRSFFRAHGDEGAARAVAIAALDDRRRTLPPAARAWAEFLRWSVGYGYRTWQAALWLAGIVAVGWLVFALAWPGHMHALKPHGPETPPFHAWLYSLDVVLPVVDLGQQGTWVPTGPALGWYVAGILAGWILVTAVVGALTAALVRN